MADRLLVVDADPLFGGFLALLLEHDSYDVTTCPTLAEALSALATQPFDLVLADGLSLRAAVAWETAGSILRAAGPTPVILVSAHQFDPDTVRAAGYQDCLQKPFDLDDLERRIMAVLAQDGAPSTSPPA